MRTAAQSSTATRPSFHLQPPVKVEIIRTDDDGEEESLGTGTLIDCLEEGARVRMSVAGSTLRTSPLQEIVLIDARTVEIRTANRTYRLSKPVDGGRPELMEATRQRLDHLRARAHRARRTGTGFTGSGNVATPPKPGAGTFCSGSRVRVTRIRGADGISEQNGSLGVARLLDDLQIGASARFALDDGATIATSPVRSLERLGPSSLQFATGNSTYRFDLLQ